MSKSPCLNCNDRTDYGKCHDSCEKYKQSKENQANVQAARNKFLKGKGVIAESAIRKRNANSSTGKKHKY